MSMICCTAAARHINSDAFIAHEENQDLYGVTRTDNWQDLAQGEGRNWRAANRNYQRVFMHALSAEKARMVAALPCNDNLKLDIFYASSDIDALTNLLNNETNNERGKIIDKMLVNEGNYIDNINLIFHEIGIDLVSILGHIRDND